MYKSLCTLPPLPPPPPCHRSDLNDKKRLTDALAQERESYAQLESDFQASVI